jgi:hypothetical protein
MKLHPLIVVTGSRVCKAAPVTTVLNDTVAELSSYGQSIIAHGYCPTGADAHADHWGYQNIATRRVRRVERLPAYWPIFKKPAGTMRNGDLCERAWVHQEAGGIVVVLAFPQGESPGTRHMIDLCNRMQINDVRVYEQETTP